MTCFCIALLCSFGSNNPSGGINPSCTGPRNRLGEPIQSVQMGNATPAACEGPEQVDDGCAI
jgi:hypothetical protein